MFFFFFQAEDGIRDTSVTGVQTCALPIFLLELRQMGLVCAQEVPFKVKYKDVIVGDYSADLVVEKRVLVELKACEIGRASCRERVEISVVAGWLKENRNVLIRRVRCMLML